MPEDHDCSTHEYPDDLDGVALILVRLPKRVQAEIDRRGLSYRQAAREINGFTHTHIFNICKGKTQPTLRKTVDLISWLQISSHHESK